MAPATSFKMFSWKRKPGAREASPAVDAVPQVVVSPATDDDPRMALPKGISPPLRSRTSSRPTSPSSASFGTSGPHWARGSSVESYSSAEYRLEPKTPPSSYSTAATSRAPLPSTPHRTTVIRAGSPSDEAAPIAARRIGYGQRSPERRVTSRSVAQQPQACRVSSLYASSAGSTSSLSTIMDSGRTPLGSTRRQSGLWRDDASQPVEPPAPALPMFNIIPATPKNEDLDRNEDVWQKKRDPSSAPTSASVLAEAIEISSPSLDDRSEAVYEWAAECGGQDVITPHWSPAASVCSSDYFDPLPMIDIDLDFSPFSPVVGLPEEQMAQTTPTVTNVVLASQPSSAPPSAPLPPSPPFLSYPSLPSLSSVSSSLSTSSSLCSFPDVDEALGSMLASLSEPNLSGANAEGEPKRWVAAGETRAVEPSPVGTGLGLGLGLGLEDVPPLVDETPRAPSVTQPLVPRPQRRPPPPPLILADRPSIAGPSVLGSPLRSPSTAPLIKNHRLAFYNRAQAHPASPTAGVFINLDGASPASSSGKTPLPGQQLTHSGSGYFPLFQPSGASSSSASSTSPTSARSSTCSSLSSESGIASSDSNSSVGDDGVDDEDELAIQTASILSLVPSPAEGRSKPGLIASPAVPSEEWVAKTRSAEVVGWAM